MLHIVQEIKSIMQVIFGIKCPSKNRTVRMNIYFQQDNPRPICVANLVIWGSQLDLIVGKMDQLSRTTLRLQWHSNTFRRKHSWSDLKITDFIYIGEITAIKVIYGVCEYSYGAKDYCRQTLFHEKSIVTQDSYNRKIREYSIAQLNLTLQF